MATRNPKPRRRVVSPLQRPDGSFPAGSRVVIDVRWKPQGQVWQVSWREGARLGGMIEDESVKIEGALQYPGPLWQRKQHFQRKSLAVREAARTARALWAGGDGWDRIPAQVRIYRDDGALQSERTFPDVTPRRRG